LVSGKKKEGFTSVNPFDGVTNDAADHALSEQQANEQCTDEQCTDEQCTDENHRIQSDESNEPKTLKIEEAEESEIPVIPTSTKLSEVFVDKMKNDLSTKISDDSVYRTFHLAKFNK